MVNIKKKDIKIFCTVSRTFGKPVVEHAQRPSQYVKDLNSFDVSEIKFPVTLNQIEKFEQQNPDFSMNVYKLDKIVDKEVELIPLYTAPERNRKYHAHLLQTGNSSKPHYVVINNMSRLLFDQTTDRHKMYICKYCLTTFSKESVLEAHECDNRSMTILLKLILLLFRIKINVLNKILKFEFSLLLVF